MSAGNKADEDKTNILHQTVSTEVPPDEESSKSKEGKYGKAE